MYEIRQAERKKEEGMKKKANRIKWKINHKEKEESVLFWSKNKIKLSLKPEIKVPRNTKSRMKRNKTNNAVKRRRRKGSWEKTQDVTRPPPTKQFKQLKSQTLRFNREAASPGARFVLMRSNKRFKPGD